jgi:hypothetical protein
MDKDVWLFQKLKICSIVNQNDLRLSYESNRWISWKWAIDSKEISNYDQPPWKRSK